MPWDRRTFVFSEKTLGWTEYTTGFYDGVEYFNRRFIGGPSNPSTLPSDNVAEEVHEANEGVYEFPPGTIVEGVMETGWIRLGGPGAKARVRRIEMTMSGTDDPFVVEMFRDFDEDNVYVTRTVNLGENSYPGSGGGNTERVVALDGWGNRLTSVKFRVTTTIVNIEHLDIFFTGGTEGAGQNLRGETHSTGVGGQVRQGG